MLLGSGNRILWGGPEIETGLLIRGEALELAEADVAEDVSL